jgi:hypothetical protein
MKIKKGPAFLITHITFFVMFLLIVFFAPDQLLAAGVPIILAMAANIAQFCGFQVADNWQKGKNYHWELDSNMKSKTEKIDYN